MRILFVYTMINVKLGSYGFQYGLASLSAYLKEHGYRDIRLCYMSPHYDGRQFQRQLEDFKPHVIAFYVSWDQYRFVKDLLALVKDREVFTICGGPHPTLNPDCLLECERLDALCVGEGERVLLEVVRSLERGERPEGVAGLHVKHGDRIVRSEPGPFLSDLDALPPVDRELFAEGATSRRFGFKSISGENGFRLTRGCPFGCAFCSNKALSSKQAGRYVRYRSAQRVVAEILACRKRYDLREINFMDDTFMANEALVEEFCGIYRREVRLPFDFYGHIPMKNKGLLARLKDAGGRRIGFGIETGNEEFRRTVINKHFSNEEAVETFAYVKSLGFMTEAFTIIGLPGETPRMFDDTEDLIRKIQPDMYTLTIYFPLPGTALHDRAVKMGYLPPHLELPRSYVTFRSPLLAMPDFPDRLIRQRNQWFGYNVYRETSLKKAIAFFIYESPWGDFLLRLVSPFRKVLGRFIFG
ncbi:MAG: radical SAM protein [Elusimicrobia bacterium]|nr:radical SAM protein [Elusimicrobiota bacterium]